MRTAIGSAAEDKPHDWLFFNVQVRLKKKKEEKNVTKKKVKHIEYLYYLCYCSI